MNTNIQVDNVIEFLKLLRNQDYFNSDIDLLYNNLKLSDIEDKNLKILLFMYVILVKSTKSYERNWILENLNEIYKLGFKEIVDNWLSMSTIDFNKKYPLVNYNKLQLSNIEDKNLKILLVMHAILTNIKNTFYIKNWIINNIEEIYKLGFNQIVNDWFSISSSDSNKTYTKMSYDYISKPNPNLIDMNYEEDSKINNNEDLISKPIVKPIKLQSQKIPYGQKLRYGYNTQTQKAIIGPTGYYFIK